MNVPKGTIKSREENTFYMREHGIFDGYALFMAIKEKFGGVSFDRWPDEYKFAKKRSLRKFKAENQKEYLFWLFLQYEFSKQWNTLSCRNTDTVHFTA